jgi:hypothetical protein
MKSLIRVIIVIIISFISAEIYAGNFYFGAKGGGNLSTIFGPDAGNLGLKPGFIAGPFIGLVVAKSIAIQTEFLYSMKGAKIKNSPNGTNNDGSIKLNYFEIPILWRTIQEAGHKSNSNFMMGPVFGYNTNSSASIKGVGGSTNVHINGIKGYDIGIMLGIEIVTKRSNMSAGIEGRYTMGLVSIDNTYFKYDYKNSTISVMVNICSR